MRLNSKLKHTIMSINVELRTERTRTTDFKVLVLWYDEAVDLESIIKSTADICKISEKESINLVLDSLLDGCAKIMTGNNETLIPLQSAFREKLINTTIE